MRVTIAGSSGQVGTNLALRCMDDGHHVTGFDRRANPWSSRIDTIETDLAGSDWTLQSKPDLVVHLAANAKVHDLVRHPERAMENSRITFRVLEACRLWKTPLLYASSREVYGENRRELTCESDAHFGQSESPYAAAKIADEAMIHAYARCYGLRFLVVRLSNVYGRYDNDSHRMERVMPLFIDRMRRNEPVVIFGAHKVLDFTYVDDCVDGVMRAMELLATNRIANEALNLSGGHGHTLVEMADFVARALGRQADMTFRPSRPGEITHYVADLEKARRLLHFDPRVSLEEGVHRAVAWNNAHAAQSAA